MSSTTVDISNLQKRLSRLSVLEEKSGPQVLKDQGRLFVRDVLKLTPPTGGANPLNESFAAQRKAGEQAVRSDFSKIWTGPDAFIKSVEKTHPRAARYLARYARAGRIGAVKKMAADMGYRVRDVVVSISEADHDRRRNRETGRPSRLRSLATMVLRSNSIKAVLRAKLKKIGTAKGGWAGPARQLGQPVPSWITGHPRSRSLYEPKLSGPRKSLTIGNLVDFAQKYEGSHRLVATALRLRAKAMDLRIQHLSRSLK